MMEDKWCPENDGSYRMEMAAIHRYSVDQQLHRARAEITQLRAEIAESRASEHGLFGRLETCRQDGAALKAELAAERELAERLYSAIEYIDDYCLAYPELEAVSAVSSSAIDYVDTRRNK